LGIGDIKSNIYYACLCPDVSRATVTQIRGGHAQLFLRSAIAIPHFEGSTFAIAIPLFKLFKECWSATAIPEFFNRVFVILIDGHGFYPAIINYLTQAGSHACRQTGR
jgi:hypothetical protein